MQKITDIKAFFATLAEKLKERPEIAKEVGASYCFEISGPGGGNFTVDLKGAEPSVQETSNPADCLITASAEHFLALVNDPGKAAMYAITKKVKLVGPLPIAMKLGKLLELHS